MRTLKAGVIYFLLVFALGWILGPIREVWAVPHFGRLTAMLLEAAIMLIAMIVVARWVIRRFEVPQTLATTIPMGLIAIGLLFPAEIAGVLWVRGLSTGISSGFCDRPRRHLNPHVPAVCRDANPRHASRTRPYRGDHLNPPISTLKATGAASRSRTEIGEGEPRRSSGGSGGVGIVLTSVAPVARNPQRSRHRPMLRCPCQKQRLAMGGGPNAICSQRRRSNSLPD